MKRTVAGGADRVGDAVDRHARDWRLAGRVDVGEHDLVGGAERRAELREQIPRACVAVRLEHDHQPPPRRARRGDHRGNLGGMMAVVVDDHHAAALAAHLEAPFGAAEFPERLRDAAEGHLELEADRDSPQRVEQVVPAGHLQPQRSELDLAPVDSLDDGAARAERLELHVASGDVGVRFAGKAVGDHAPDRARHQRPHRVVVGAQDRGTVERHLVDELEERVLAAPPSCRRPPCARGRCS